MECIGVKKILTELDCFLSFSQGITYQRWWHTRNRGISNCPALHIIQVLTICIPSKEIIYLALKA